MPLLLLLLLCLPATAAEQYKSGEAQNQLVELYTSEGCSSCPPADRFLSAQKSSDLLWRRRIPVAFHVDYWDALGWPDHHAQNRHTRRQSKYKLQGATDAIYTPQFVVAGTEWKDYFVRKSLPPPPRQKVGRLSLSIVKGNYQAHFQPTKASGELYVLNIVQLAMSVTQRVEHGENRGMTLTHDFLAVDHLQNLNQGHRWEGKIREIKNAVALAAWISTPYSQTPYQVVGGIRGLE